MEKIERFIPQLAGQDYNKVISVNARGTESKKDIMDLEYFFNDEKLTVREFILKLCQNIEKLQEENKLLKEELLLKMSENKNLQDEINKNFMEYLKDGGII